MWVYDRNPCEKPYEKGFLAG